MSITETLELYIKNGNYFDPAYERENEVLTAFKKSNPELSTEQTSKLAEILRQDSEHAERYFVADLLYLYNSFDKELMEPMLENSIELRDPSFNRIFLVPCLRAFGAPTVLDWLTSRFNSGNSKNRIRISSLIYHLNMNGVNSDQLKTSILEHANRSNNLIELYHFKLALGSLIPDDGLPKNAHELTSKVQGDKEYERLLFEDLGWRRN